MNMYKVTSMLDYSSIDDFCPQYFLVNASNEKQARDFIEEYYKHQYDKPKCHIVSISLVDATKAGLFLKSHDRFWIGEK